MILVTLGTQDKEFTRLLKMLEDAIVQLEIKDEVLVQAGYTKYESSRMQIFDYIGMSEYDQLLKKCDLLVTHGGVGTMLTALQMNKKIIACPRLAKYEEHHNDHQQEIVDSFSKKGYILACNNLDELVEVLKQAEKFTPNKFESNHVRFLELIKKEIGV